jgi:hypothetical protein
MAGRMDLPTATFKPRGIVCGLRKPDMLIVEFVAAISVLLYMKSF